MLYSVSFCGLPTPPCHREFASNVKATTSSQREIYRLLIRISFSVGCGRFITTSGPRSKTVDSNEETCPEPFPVVNQLWLREAAISIWIYILIYCVLFGFVEIYQRITHL